MTDDNAADTPPVTSPEMSDTPDIVAAGKDADASPEAPQPVPPADSEATAEAEPQSDPDGSPASDLKELRAEAKRRRLENEQLRAELSEARVAQRDARRIVAAQEAGLPAGAHRFLSGDTDEDLASSVSALQDFIATVNATNTAAPVDLGQTGGADTAMTKNAALRAMLND